MATIPQTPRRSRPKTGHNPDLHNHSDLSSGGRISALDLLDIAALSLELTPVSDHGLLLGLADDDHLQYLLLAGRAGGQTVYGGTASGNGLALRSTSHATKGKVIFGTAGTTVYDEVNERFGVKKATPTAGLHVLATPVAAVVVPTSTLQTGDIITYSWQSSTYGGPVTGNPPTGNDLLWYQEIDDRIDSGFLRLTSFPGSYRAIFGLGSTISSAISNWTITYSARIVTAGGAIPADATFSFRLGRSDAYGDSSTSRLVASYYTGSFVTYVETITSVGASSQTANSLELNGFTGAVGGIPAGSGLDIEWVEVSTAGGGGGEAVTIFELGGSSSLPFSIWRDAAALTVASVSSAGAGQFQNVLLEDPGAGTGTVTLKAPTGVTSWAMTLPADDGAAGEVLNTDGAGVTDWVTFASLLDDDLEAIAAIADGSTGLLAKTAANTWALRTLTAPAAGLTISNPAGIAGNPTFALSNDLAALEALSATGIVRRTATDAWSAGTLVTLAEMADLTQQVFIGRSSLSTGVPQAVSLGAARTMLALDGSGLLQGNGVGAVTAVTNSTTVGQILRVTGSNAYGWGALDLADTDAITNTLPLGNGGTGNTSGTATVNANLTGHVTSVGNAAVLNTTGAFTSANLLAALSDKTGTGLSVFATSPTLVTPLLGTPTSGVLTNCTGLPETSVVDGTLLARVAANEAITGTWTFSHATSQAIFSGAGAVSMGSTAPSTAAKLYVAPTFSSAAAAGVEEYGFRALPIWSAAGTAGTADVTSIKQGFRADAFTTHTSGTYGTLYGGVLLARAFGAGGTVTNATAVFARVDCSSASAVITNAVGLDLPSPTATGTLTNVYGIRIANATGATLSRAIDSSFNSGTGKYNLYIQGTAPNYLKGALGIDTLTATELITLGGAAARSVIVERHPTANTAGNSLTVQAGGATSAATNKAGGGFVVKTGVGTGNSTPAHIFFQAPAQGTASGTTDQTIVNRLVGNGSSALTSGAATTIATIDLGDDQMAGGDLFYLIEAADGTDTVALAGAVRFSAVHKYGTSTTGYTVSVSEIGTPALANSDATDNLTAAYNVVGLTNQIALQLTPTLTGMTATTFRITTNLFNQSQQQVSSI